MYTDYRVRKLSDHPGAQCRVRLYDNGDICFQSYQTDVLYYHALFKRLYVTGTYSRTTAKQITWFLREYFPNLSYSDCKNAYHNDCRINVDVVTRLSLTPLLTATKKLLQEANRYGRTLCPSDIVEVSI